MSRPLDDVVVFDLTRTFGASLAGAFLGDFGARVIRLELEPVPPRSDAQWNHEADLIHRNKESVALAAGSAQGRAVLHALLAKADAFVTDWSVAELAALGIDYEGATRLRADIVYGRLSGFGPVGPDKDLPPIDELAAARTGMMPILPQPGQPPVYSGSGAMHAAVMLAFGVVTALVHRVDSGEGQEVDVSLFGANMYGAALDIQAFL
ncbi:MAG TPA: CoA transferase, partial [Rubrivivax sp.]|nr:CoA transferase [Rubrivivax sp.]